MANTRIYEIARELGLESKQVLAKAKELGFSPKTASSSLDPSQTGAVRAAFRPAPAPKPDPEPEPTPPPTKEEEEAQAIQAVRAFEQEQAQRAKAKEQPAPIPEEVEVLTVPAEVSVQEMAYAMHRSVGEVIRKLLSMGFMAAAAAPVPAEAIEPLGEEFGFLVEVEAASAPREAEQEVSPQRAKLVFDDQPDQLVGRPPVVTVMGHVDHGKTTLLDAIRQANVVEEEAGGITQHIGAYQVEVGGNRLTFIDTPGHEAFTDMRARGAEVTDIVVLVVAANDGVMPQTVEAISHAKAADVTMIVAINKIDLEQADPVRTRAMLTEYEVVTEELGGDVVSVEVSATQGKGIDTLLEMIDLHAQVNELQSNPTAPASGTVVESHLDPGKGAIATVIVQRGTLKQGDSLVAGTVSGRVRAMEDDKGKRIKQAGPSTPVLISGWSGVPAAGDVFQVMQDDRQARALATELVAEQRARDLVVPTARQRLGRLLEQLGSQDETQLPLVIKADADGSVGAIRDAAGKLSVQGGQVKVVHTAVGGINENDVRLADTADAVVVGFNVRPSAGARRAASQSGVEIRTYSIIYELLDDLKLMLAGRVGPEEVEQVLGSAEVRAIFRVPRLGSVAGSYVTEGSIVRDSPARLVRDGIVIYDGKVASLRRFKEDVREVSAGFECGIGLDRFRDIKEGDIIEAYRIDEVAVA